MKQNIKIGLALAGGGARGAAHIGVLQVLHDNKIPIDLIAGTSAGAIIGAMYAATLDPGWVEKRYMEYIDSDEFRAVGVHHIRKGDEGNDSFLNQLGKFVKDKLVITVALSRKGIIQRSKLAASIEYLLPVRDFSELKIPLKVVISDLNQVEAVVVSSGDLIEAVTLSSAVPGFVAPSPKNGQLLVDGGVVSPLPINVLLDTELDMTIAVDIARRELKILKECNLMELMSRAGQVTSVKLSDELSRKADVLIEPDVGGAHWSEFPRIGEFINNGRESTQKALPLLKREMEKRKRWSYHFRQWVKARI
ncbi:MAG: patatin-like phospholipase family protein [Candidatus Marinimicrobia bacterium]|jgi:NTE family protein|nr:patatin-like phospholipase family protein [Candidatus Neomarinimicrobiota bacterium]MDP6592700.1 patatin-like phospholipase family protein [Candidatus Neomarinimicrobiota bacterium]MDP6835762.1 patatin-like phospholipase family protein [Candidatus Neomarinimicrobiota bacterium]MDP6966372.1 patatin-like phospholipase family protein [Candidatus Neomarinimicrobiota bacterium]|tara:strand:+ start:1934 stop:2854 length:921 start_codon:yes stop_codon:yes gene_type:complete